MTQHDAPLERKHAEASELHAYAADLHATHARHMRRVGNDEAVERAERLAAKERKLADEERDLAHRARRGSSR